MQRLLRVASFGLALGLNVSAFGGAVQNPPPPQLAQSFLRLREWDGALQQLTSRTSALGSLERELSGLYLSLVPSLVEVRSSILGPEGAREVSAAGVVLTADGLVVAPVFLSAERVDENGVQMAVEVRRGDGEPYTGRILATNEDYGLALIRVDGLRGMQPTLFPGEWLPEGAPVIALGNAFGLDATMSIGLLTGRARYAGNARRLLQISNPVNPGDGGGLLASARGEVVGILLTGLPELAEAGIDVGVERVMGDTPAGLGATDRARALRAEGIGFAVPIEIVASLFPDQLGGLLKRKRGFGVAVTSRLLVTELPEGPVRRWVVKVQSVLPDSAAAAAGVLAGDILLELDGAPLATLEDLGFAMFHAPERAALLVLRAGAPERLVIDFSAWTVPLPEFGADLPEREPNRDVDD